MLILCHLHVANFISVKLCLEKVASIDVFVVHLPAFKWRFSVAVTRWSRSTQLLYIEPG